MKFTIKVVALAIASTIATSLATGCAAVPSTPKEAGTASPPPVAATDHATPSPELSETIQVRVDKWVFGMVTDEQILSNATDNGYTATVDSNNDDGTIIIYTMTREQQQETLNTLRANILKAHTELTEGDSTSFIAVNTSPSMDDFEVRVDSDRYRKSETSQQARFYREAALFQGMAGVEPENVAWKLRFVDDDTDKVLYSRSYRGPYVKWMLDSKG